MIEVRCDRCCHLCKNIRSSGNDSSIRFEKDGVHLVEGVARFVMHRTIRSIVEPQIKGRNAMKHKGSMIRIESDFHGNGPGAQVPQISGPNRYHRFLQIFTSFDLPTFWMTGTIIGIEDGHEFVEFLKMLFDID